MSVESRELKWFKRSYLSVSREFRHCLPFLRTKCSWLRNPAVILGLLLQNSPQSLNRRIGQLFLKSSLKATHLSPDPRYLMAQKSHLFTFPPGSDVACHLAPQHMFTVLSQTARSPLSQTCQRAPTPFLPRPLSADKGLVGHRVTHCCKFHPQHSCQGLLLFPGLLGRASVVVTDRHSPPWLHATSSPHLCPCSVPSSSLSNQHP